jgi:hypothetical protein
VIKVGDAKLADTRVQRIAQIQRDLANLKKEIATSKITVTDSHGETEIEAPITFDVAEIEKLWIKNKKNKVIRIRLNAAQLKIVSMINEMSLERLPVRLVLEKARRFGGSTLFCALGYILMRDHHYRVTIIGHKTKSSSTLYEMIRLFHARDMAAPATTTNTKGQLSLITGGSAWVVTAGKDEIERSVTNQVVIATEYALWPRAAGDLMNAAGETVSEIPNTFFFIESTARGMNDFYTKCHEAEAGKDEFGNPVLNRFCFIGWQDIEEYSMPFASEEERNQFVASMEHADNAEELVLHDSGITLEQLNWRRRHITKMTGSDRQMKIKSFKQEFPSTWREAFLTPGGSVFNQDVLAKWKQKSQDTPILFEGEINNLAQISFAMATDADALPDIIIDGFRAMMGGRLRIWEWPKPYTDYDMGVDVAEGIEDSQYKADDSAITILEHVSGRQVAAWRGKEKPEYFDSIIVALAWFYGEAYTCVESNKDGRSVIQGMIRLNYPEYRMYKRKGGTNIAHLEQVDKLGFQTSMVTKPDLINVGRSVISFNKATILDAATISEFSKLQIDKRGLTDTGGKDSLMSALLAFECREQAFPYKATQVPVEIDAYKQWKLAIKAENDLAQRQRATGMGAMRNKPEQNSFEIAI